MAAPLVLAVDGNSLVHRSFHAQAHTAQPCWAVRGLLTSKPSGLPGYSWRPVLGS